MGQKTNNHLKKCHLDSLRLGWAWLQSFLFPKHLYNDFLCRILLWRYFIIELSVTGKNFRKKLNSFYHCCRRHQKQPRKACNIILLTSFSSFSIFDTLSLYISHIASFTCTPCTTLWHSFLIYLQVSLSLFFSLQLFLAKSTPSQKIWPHPAQWVSGTSCSLSFPDQFQGF